MAKKDIAWPQVGERWRLLRFSRAPVQPWEIYLREQREYWGEDRISGERSHFWQWDGDERKWLDITKQKYRDYVEHCSKWLGIFTTKDGITAVRADRSNVLKLCIEQNGRTTLDKTVELWLFAEGGLFSPKETKCEVYTFSTIVDDSGRKKVMSWRQETPAVIWSNDLRHISIGGASFEVTP